MVDFVVSVEYQDNLSAGMNAATASLNSAANAADNLDATVTKVGRSASSFIGQFDPLAASAKSYTKALSDLSNMQASFAAQNAAGQGDTDAQARAIDNLTQKVLARKAAMDAMTGALGASTEAESTAANTQAQALARTSALTAALDAATQSQAQFNAALNVQGTSASSYASRSADIEAYGNALDALKAKYNPIFAVSKQYEDTLSEISMAEKVGALTSAEASAAMDKATASYAAANNPLKGLTSATADAAKSADDLTSSHGQTAFATRQLGVQMTQLFSGIATGQPVLTSLIQQGHQVGDVMLSTGVGVKGMVGAIADMISPTVAVVAGAAAFAAGVYLLGSAAESTQSQMLSMQAALRSTRDDYVSMAAEATAAAKAVSAASGFNTSDSRQAAQSFAAVPAFTGNQQQLQALVLTAGDLATVMGVTLPAAAQKLATAMQDPAKLAQDWANSQSFGMTQAMADSIKTMQEGGDKAGAFAADLDALKSKAQGAAQDSLTPLQQSIQNLGKAFSDTSANSDSFVKSLGTYVVDAATASINALTAVVGAVATARKELADDAAANDARGMPSILNPMIPQGTMPAAPLPTPAPTAASIAPFLQQAASANSLDPALLAQLQYYENAAPKADGSWANSSSGRVGPMQVSQGTFAGVVNQPSAFPTAVGATDITSPQQNVQVGAALFAHLLQKYGDVSLAVLAYHDGEPAIDKVLASGGSVSPSDAALAEARTVTAGYTGNGFTASGNSPVLPLDVTGALPVPPIPPAATGDANGVSNSSLVSDALARIGGSTTTGVATSSAANIKDDIAALAQLASQGDTTSVSVQKLNEDLQKQQLAFQNAIQPAQALLDTTSRQTVGEDDITAAYADGMAAVDHMTNSVKAEQQARQFAQAGTEQYTAIVDALTAAYDKSTKSMQTRQAESQNVDNKQQLDYLNAELSTLTESSTVRATDLAVMKEKQDIQKNMPDLDQAEQDKLIANAAAIANATTQLQTQQAAISEIGSALTNVANQLGQAISDSFLSGTGAAVNWGNVTKAVIASVLQELVKLAIINPLMNAALGTNSTTLGGVISVLGSSGGTTTTSASGSNLLSSGSSAVSLIGGANTLSGGSLLQALGLTGPGGLTEQLGLSGSNGLLSGASGFLTNAAGTGILNAAVFGSTTAEGTNAAIGALGAGVYGPATPAAAAAASGVTTVGSLAGGIGLGFAAGSLLGGGVQSLTNKTGPGPEIGAGAGAIGGAVAGSFIAPGIGTIIGGLIGGLVGGAGGGLIGPAPASTYGGVSLAVGSDGLLQAGISSSQGNSGITADQAVATQNIDSVNAFLTSHGLKIASAGTNGTGVIANSNTPGNANPGGVSWIGSATTPGDPNFFSDLDTPNDTTGKSLFSGFQFSSADPLLNADISGKSFANTAALVSEVTAFQAAEAAISTLLTTVVPALTTTAVNTGTLTASLEATAQPYDQAIAAAKLLLTTNAATTDQTNQLVQSETDLATARDKATAAIVASVAATYDQIDKTTAGASLSAYASITGNPADQETADLYAFDNSATQQEAAFKAQLIATYGDSVVTTQGYADQMTALENSLGLQRLAIQTQYYDKLVASAQTGVSSLAAEVTKLQTGSASPLSPSAQYSLASNQFNAVAGAAQAGDWNSYQNISTYADSLLSASQAYNGSGSAYAADYSRVLGQISSLAAETPDQLTASIYTIQMQTQTQILSAGLDSLRAQVASLQTALVQANGMPTRASGWSK